MGIIRYATRCYDSSLGRDACHWPPVVWWIAWGRPPINYEDNFCIIGYCEVHKNDYPETQGQGRWYLPKRISKEEVDAYLALDEVMDS